ncbi:hypothetical protein N7468_001190 [Penicillium chermesinum]|uniref:C2H2-type domain-containing protein n=1 Tax=Penicillium chermesinum TaxID=63820 RepID=A0A9W9PJ40_9EURO|nr:uncharacterized protein N7468_001190 [Penicillium chermesinum]KAJ5246207.1 hypothetical protein N7468_001190 [Penicillium chermesinum]KAJ6144495.1 hypothetical protein N7470_008390 [Penicillium chermesinum]
MNSDSTDGFHTGTGEAGPSSGHVQCEICNNTFRRPEHLKRHVRSHTKEKPFRCNHCGRYFSRTDTLHRHELSHHSSDTDGRDRPHRITVKTFRACFGCATARPKSRDTQTVPAIFTGNTTEQSPSPPSRHLSQRESRPGDVNSMPGIPHVQVESLQTIQFQIEEIQEPASKDRCTNTPSDFEVYGPTAMVNSEFVIPEPSVQQLDWANRACQSAVTCSDMPYDFLFNDLEESQLEAEGSWLGTTDPGPVFQMNMIDNPEMTLNVNACSFDELVLSSINWTSDECKQTPKEVDYIPSSLYPQPGFGFTGP